jgi:DNA (cytosine-5)-methyltransferase 1
MREQRIDYAPVWDDVRTLDAEELSSCVDRIEIITGGFPCQDISVAGTGTGLGGSRSGLFFEIVRLTRELRPRFVFLENVPAITVRGLDRVLLEFAALGYDCRWTIVSAAEVGAPHLRERWFLLAYSKGQRYLSGRESEHFSEKDGRSHGSVRAELSGSGEKSENLANSMRAGLEGYRHQPFRIESEHPRPFGPSWWAIEPNVGRVVNGIPLRVDRLRGLGNAVVPAQAREAFERLVGLK